MTGRKNNHGVGHLLLEFENPGELHSELHAECRILPITHKKNNSGFRNGRDEILTRAEDAWGFMTGEERNEYSNRAFFLPIDGFTLFFYEYLSLSGAEPQELMNVLKSVKPH